MLLRLGAPLGRRGGRGVKYLATFRETVAPHAETAFLVYGDDVPAVTLAAVVAYQVARGRRPDEDGYVLDRTEAAG